MGNDASVPQGGRIPALAVLLVLVVAGGLLRLHDLGARPMGHTELYTPGLSYAPADLSVPPPRTTWGETLRGSTREPHPPAWYLAMFAWTRAFGTDLFTIRLPSVLCGTAVIVLVYLLASLHGDRLEGLVAAALTAFSGPQIAWSQIARPYVGATLLGVAATYLLLRLLTTAPQRPGMLRAAYLATILVGLLTNYYFWILFAVHVLWVLLRSADGPRLMLGVARAQLALLILVSPVVCLAAYQAFRPSYLGAFHPDSMIAFLTFGFLRIEEGTATPLPFVASLLLLVVSVLLWALALGTRAAVPITAPSRPLVAPSRLVLIGLTTVALSCCIGAWYAGEASLVPRMMRRQRHTVAWLGLVPPVLLIVALALERHATTVLAISRRAQTFLAPVLASPVVALALVSALGITLVSLLVDSIYATRHMLIFAPYVLITLAGGMCTLARLKRRAVAGVLVATLAAVLIPAHGASVLHSYSQHWSSPDYKGLAEQWRPELRDSDLILVRRNWRTTPLFYYVDGSRYRYVGSAYAEAIRSHPRARVWVLSFDHFPESIEAKAALARYRSTLTLRASEMSVSLYEPPS